jgi:thiol:disulfide interchange protein
MKHAAMLFLAVCALGSAQPRSPLQATLQPQQLELRPGDTATVWVALELQPGWYTYGLERRQNEEGIGPEPLQLEVGPAELLRRAGQIRAPRPRRKYDEGFQMEVDYYVGRVRFGLPVQLQPAVTPGEHRAVVSVVYQVCDSTRCLPPDELVLPLTVRVVQTSGSATGSEDTAAKVSSPEAPSGAVQEGDAGARAPVQRSAAQESSVQGSDGAALKQPRSLWALLALAAGAGALALLTPCVFPMIPITVSFFTKRAERQRRRALRDAALYALGIVVTFVGLGTLLSLLFGATGIRDFAADPWVNLLIAAIFVAFALNLFGAYEIVLPAGVLNRLNRASEQHGTLGVLLMGLTFSLTSFTCTVPFVGSALIALASGEWFYPIVGMLGFATVFAAPFFLLALFPAALMRLPRAGGWMNNLKVVMGFLELAAAVKFLSNADLVWGWGLISPELFLASWVVCGALITAYVLGLFRLPHDTPLESVGPIRALVAVFFGTLTLWLASGLWGARLGELEAFLPPRDYHRLLQGASAPSGASTAAQTELEWYEDLEQGLAEARRTGRPVFVDFTGFTCTNCRWMEHNIFPQPRIRALLEQMVRVRLFTDRRTEPYLSNKRLQQERFGTIELPFYVLLAPDGSVIARATFTRDVEEFERFLRQAFVARASVQ